LILEVWVVPLRAQNTGAGIAGAALAQRVQYRLRYAGGIHDQSGTWLAAEGMAHLGLVFIRTSLASGALSGDTSAVNPDRTFRVTSLSIGIRPTAWLEFGPDVMARRVESSASTVIWRLLGGHLGIALPLGLEGLAGTATGTYYASRAVTGDEKLNLALTGELGVSFAPPGIVMMLRISYRFERYDFDALGGNQPRLEQARSLVAGVGLSLRR
jgi:hypothetical protein